MKKVYSITVFGRRGDTSYNTTKENLLKDYEKIGDYSNPLSRECLQGEPVFSDLQGPFFAGQEDDLFIIAYHKVF